MLVITLQSAVLPRVKVKFTGTPTFYWSLQAPSPCNGDNSNSHNRGPKYHDFVAEWVGIYITLNSSCTDKDVMFRLFIMSPCQQAI